jgi:hypothetical protein
MMTQRAGAERTRHIIFLALWVLILATLIWPIPTHMKPSPAVRSLYNAIEKLPRNKLVILSVSWDVGTRGENGPQTAALINHLFRSGRRFSIFGCAWPTSPMLAEQIAESLAPRYGRHYGTDWVNWGFKAGGSPMLQALAKDIPGIISQDTRHTRITEVPAMAGVRDYHDIGMVIDITGQSTLDAWVAFWQGPYGVPLGYACTGVMGPEAFPYLDAGQIKGVINGLVGAAEYEVLLGVSGDGQQRMTSQSAAHLMIIALIVLGNLLMMREAKRKAQNRG